MMTRLNISRFLRSAARNCALAALGLFFTLESASVSAQEAERLKDVRAELESAEARKKRLEADEKRLARELSTLSNRLVAAAQAVRDQEITLIRLEEEIITLDAQQQELTDTLVKRRAQLGQSLAALQNLSRQPPQLLLLRPASATDTARSAILLNSVLPRVRAQADALRIELSELAALRASLENRREEQRLELGRLEDARMELNALRQERAKQRELIAAQAEEEAKRIAKLVTESRTLEELVAKLEKERERLAAVPSSLPRPDKRRAQDARSFAKAQGALPLPVIGQLLAGYGEKTDQGTLKGVQILTRDRAPVISPFDGTIMYADNFRSYGQLLIIQHSEGYHSVLAGMERLDAATGQWVLTGEPVGEMGESVGARKKPGNPEGRPVLYVELQRNGKPVNPLPWLSAKLERAKP